MSDDLHIFLMNVFRHHLHWVQKTRQLRLPIRAVGSNRMPDPRLQRVPPLHLNVGPSRGYPLPPHPGSRALDLEHTARVWPRESQGRILSPSECTDIKQLLRTFWFRDILILYFIRWCTCVFPSPTALSRRAVRRGTTGLVPIRSLCSRWGWNWGHAIRLYIKGLRPHGLHQKYVQNEVSKGILINRNII